MLKKFLKDVVGIVVGKQAEDLADLLNSSKHVNEFIIAKKLGITINQTRNMLYKISDQGLVSSIRKKDKRKGWYTYFWKIEVLKSLEFLRNIILNKIEQINNQIRSREIKQFYYCEKCHVEYTEENALIHDFICPECGSLLVLKDNSPIIKDLKKSWAKLSKELEEVDAEIKIEKDKLGKSREKEFRKMEKEKKSKAEKARKERKKARTPKINKKVSLKKVKGKKKISKKSFKKKITKKISKKKR
jgi:transcription initiation factor TFIIE subunit alpha